MRNLIIFLIGDKKPFNKINKKSLEFSFCDAELKEKLGKRSYSISSARLSQVLKDLVEQGILEKEEKARYKIISKPGYDKYN